MRLPLPPAIVLLAVAASSARAQFETEEGHWPSFRASRARGIADGLASPVEFDVESGHNVLWRTPIAGLAHSSPVVWGDRVFVTTAVRVAGEAIFSDLAGVCGPASGASVGDEGVHAYRLLCLDRASGEVLWTRTAHECVPQVKRHPNSSHANPTPSCDAHRVVAFFESEGLYCYDHDGTLLWKRDVGKLEAGAPRGTEPPGFVVEDFADFQWGFASSPILVGDRVVVQCDVQDQSFMGYQDIGSGTLDRRLSGGVRR